MRTLALTTAGDTDAMSEPCHPDARSLDRPAAPFEAVPRRPLATSQIAAGLALTLLVAAAAVAAVLLLVVATARAQHLDADAVLAELEARSASLQDVSFVLEGELYDEAGQRVAVEIEVMAIRSPRAASLYIIQPDALADNVVIVTDTEIRNYTFLTNQVAVYAADDPEAFGGLFPGGEGFVLDLDLGRVFAGWEARVEHVEPGAAGDVYTLRFDNLDPAAEIHHVVAVIDASNWLPRQLTFYTREAEPFADLYLSGIEVDTGLDPGEVTWIPDDAEVIDRRR
jgi:outer membrane lipoprotein-sorting protein